MKKSKTTTPTPDHAAQVSACSAGVPSAGRRATADRVQPVAPRRQGPRVAFAGERLGWLTKESLVVLEPRHPDRQELAVALGQARGIGVAAESLLAIGQDKTEVVCRVSAQGEVERWPAVLAITPYGIVRLFADAAAKFWVVGEQAIQPVQFRLRGQSLETGESLRIGGGATQQQQLEVTELAPGAFVHAHEGELTWHRHDGSQGKVELPTDLGAVQTLAGSGREDRLWVGLEHGALALLALKPVPQVLSCIALPPGDSQVHALAASGSQAAAVLVQQGQSGQPAHWNVAVYSDDGQEKFRVALPWQPALWDEPDVSVALSGGQVPLLAVASAGRLVVWDLATGHIVLQRNRAA